MATEERARQVAAFLDAWELPRDWPDPSLAYEAAQIIRDLLEDLRFARNAVAYERRRADDGGGLDG